MSTNSTNCTAAQQQDQQQQQRLQQQQVRLENLPLSIRETGVSLHNGAP